MAGGGVGEAALMESVGGSALTGAAIGGGMSLLTGQDPIKGMMGGALGGAILSPLATPGIDTLPTSFGSETGPGGIGELGFDKGEFAGVDEAVARQAASGATDADAMAQFYGSDMAPSANAMNRAMAPAAPTASPNIPASSTPVAALQSAESNVAANQLPAAPVASAAKITPPPPGDLPGGGIQVPRNTPEFLKDPLAWMGKNKMATAAGALGLYGLTNWNQLKTPNYLQPYQPPAAQQYGLNARLASNYRPTVPMQAGGVVEQMSNANAIGQNTGYPQSGITQGAYATPWQTPISRNMLEGADDTAVDPITGQMKFSDGGGISGLMNYAKGGNVSTLGSYSDGGRLLKGPGDGMSDSIPASIENKQPARLGDGEFVVPADVVSHLGNGSTDAGAKQLYKMMDKVRQARTGRKSQGKQINPRKYMPA